MGNKTQRKVVFSTINIFAVYQNQHGLPRQMKTHFFIFPILGTNLWAAAGNKEARV